ncbi:putative regulator PrlF [compost metagenome]
MNKSNLTPPKDDPVFGQFLGLLARDITNNPERLQVVDAEFVTRIKSLASDVEIDLDAPLSADDE